MTILANLCSSLNYLNLSRISFSTKKKKEEEKEGGKGKKGRERGKKMGWKLPLSESLGGDF